MMRIKSPLGLLLPLILLTTHISCTRSGLPSVPPPAASPPPTQEQIVDKILDHYQEAIGGKAAIDAITSTRLKGTFEVGGMTGTIEGWRKEPRRTLSVMQFPRVGTLKKGFDGESLWVQTPGGTVSDSSPQQIAELERDSEVYSAGRIRSLFVSMRLESRARLNSRDMYVVEGKPDKGPAEKLFFDVENGLLVRWDMARRQPKRGTVFVKVHLEDYRDVAGVKAPFLVRFSFESFTFTVKLDELEHNIPVEDAIFQKPSADTRK